MIVMNTELKTGWLSPSGDFYPCAVYEHFDLARKILKDEYANRPDEKLHDRGFADNNITIRNKRMASILETLLNRTTEEFFKTIL